MAAIIYDPFQLSKKMDLMEKTGGRAVIAVRQAREFIQELAGSDYLDHKLSAKLTKSGGDARIENCYKFNLVGGYRLVFVWKGAWFIVLFLGTHNETDSWIRNNNGLRPDRGRGEVVPVSGRKIEDDVEMDEENDLQECLHDYDKPLHEFIDQKTLSEIFCGICGRSNNAASC